MWMLIVHSLYREVSSHNSVLDDVCMKHKNEVQSLQTERAMVEVCECVCLRRLEIVRQGTLRPDPGKPTVPTPGYD